MKIFVTSESNLERESLNAIERLLLPWRLTTPEQGNDFGRDGFIQIVEGEDERTYLSPALATFQAKATAAPFAPVHREPLSARHLAIWADNVAAPTLLIVWSRESSEARLRTARDVVSILDRGHPQWREQQTVTVSFSDTHRFSGTSEERVSLARLLKSELDREGGKSRISSYRRSCLLTALYNRGKSSTSTRAGLAPLSPQGLTGLIEGPAWRDGDVDSRDIYAPRLLASAFLLYEEVWVPKTTIATVATVLGPVRFKSALSSGRLIPYRTSSFLAFGHGDRSRVGELISATPEQNDSFYSSACLNLSKELTGGIELGELLLSSTRLIQGFNAESVLLETKRDLARSEIRNLLGLGAPKPGHAEAVWDAPLVNRVALLNYSHAVAAAEGVDVVELEGGLSRVASEKFYSLYGFSRNFATSTAFDAALRSVGVPDLGLLAEHLGFDACFQIADSESGQAFRDWFWGVASELIAAGVDVTAGVLSALRSTNVDPAALHLPCELKLRFFQHVGGEYMIGSPLYLPRHAFATRAESGSVLRRQTLNHFNLRQNHIRQMGMPKHYEPCPCNSGEKFKRCCGRPPRLDLF